MKKGLGTSIYIAATFCYAVCVFYIMMLVLELWKAQELLDYLHVQDLTVAYNGAYEVTLSGLLAWVLGKLLDIYAKKLNPKLKKGPWSITMPR